MSVVVRQRRWSLRVLGLAAASLLALSLMATTQAEVTPSVLVAAGQTLGVGVVSSLLGTGAGLLVVLATAVLGKSSEVLALRAAETVSALPALLFVPFLTAVLGGRIEWRLVVALLVLRAAQVVRLSLFEATALRTAPFVEAARSLGATRVRIWRAHLLPFLAPTLALSAGAGAAEAMVLETCAALVGFLPRPFGLGALAAQRLAQNDVSQLVLIALIGAVVVSAPLVLAEQLRDLLDPAHQRATAP